MTYFAPQRAVTRTAPTEFYDIVSAAYELATAKVGCITHQYRIANYRIRLCFAGASLVAPLTAALAHLAIPDVAEPDLTLCLWDGASTGICPPCPWTSTEVDLRGEVPAYSDEQIRTAIQRDVNAVSVLNRDRGMGFYWIDSISSLRAYERAAPLKVLLHWWLRDRGLSMIHAGAVGTADGAALLVGKTGAGKSTTTLTCLNAGMHYLSDDRCLLALEPEPLAYCIYNSAKLHNDQMSRFPNLMAAVTNWHETYREKALVHVHEFAPQQIVHPLPIRTILRANVVEATGTSLAPVSRMQLFREFSTSTLVYQPGAVHEEVHMMAELVQRVPCYQINLGNDLTQIPQVVAEAIQRAA